MIRSVFIGGWAWLIAMPGFAADYPSDAAIDPSAAAKTLAPKVVVNSGRLEWEPYKRDLTAWPSLSYEDKRPTPKPRTAEFKAPLNGDAARGREIAMTPSKGNCIACHTLPGEAWPGSVGHLLLHYKKQGYTDAHVYQQIYDRRVVNPNTVMPAFGTFGLLSDQDMRDLVAYLQNLD